MMQERIKKAADDFADKEYEISDIDRDPLYKGFYHGAQWRINSVWHDAQEEPCNGKTLIVETKNYGIFIAGPNIDTKDYECLKKEFDINRWVYVRDLLPTNDK